MLGQEALSKVQNEAMPAGLDACFPSNSSFPKTDLDAPGKCDPLSWYVPVSWFLR